MYSPNRQATHCAFCGAPFVDNTSWPRNCPGCRETTWANPLPVAVTLLPVVDVDESTRLLVVRRSIHPGMGQLALPGGYIETGETWQQAAVRELREEARIEAEAEEIELFHLDQAAQTIQIFGILPRRRTGALPPTEPTKEAEGWELLDGPVELAFPTHMTAARKFFERR